MPPGTHEGPAGGAALSGGRERRRHDRIPIRFRVEARKGEAGAPLRGMTINLSASGVLAAFPARLPLGEEVVLRLELPDDAPPLDVRALPLRVEPAPGGGSPFRVAFHFIQPAEDEVRRVRRQIHTD